ncbi:hypothetical protein Tco_0039293 [Tanacetum coccineum]
MDTAAATFSGIKLAGGNNGAWGRYRQPVDERAVDETETVCDNGCRQTSGVHRRRDVDVTKGGGLLKVPG